MYNFTIFSGVAANSLAATVQSIFYQGSTTGVFSFLQSAGASGFTATANVAMGGSASGLTASYFQSRSRNSTEFNLSVKVYAFYRRGSKYKDLENISKYLKEHFALDVENMPYIPVCGDDNMTSSFNQITCNDPDTIVAPGCLLSIRMENQGTNAQRTETCIKNSFL